MSTENIEDPRFSDTLKSSRMGFPVSKRRVLSFHVSEAPKDVKKGWSIFALVPSPIQVGATPSELSRGFDSIEWDKVAQFVVNLKTAAEKSRRESMMSMVAEAEAKAHDRTKGMVRELQDKLDIATKALAKKPLEGGDDKGPILHSKSDLLQAFAAAFIGYVAGTEILPKLWVEIGVREAGMIGILFAGLLYLKLKK